MACINAKKTCWNCPAAKFKGNVDFTACGQSRNIEAENAQIMIECRRRPGLGHFEPTITFEDCPEWEEGDYGYMLKNMKVMILGIDGYLGWALALKLGKLGCKVSGVDNYWRRDCVAEKGSHTVVPIERMTDRLHAAREVHGIDINFRRIDVMDRDKLREFMDEVKPEAIVHYAECPSAPYSMVDAKHAIKVQENNVLGTLGVLFIMKDIAPEASLIKLGTMGEYGAPLTGRPLFEGIFPSDAALEWKGRKWSLGGELTPRDPVSFYHCSKVQDTFNVYEACKYWWLRSYDIMQGVIYGVHTDEIATDPRLKTRFDMDEWFGTVVNRFVAQAVLGMPLTIYGRGEQIRAFIALDDAMQCMVRLIFSPPEPGQYDVVNQVSGLFKVSDIAEAVARVGKEKFGLEIKIQRIENPRVESEKHPLEVVSKKLPNEFGFEQGVTLEKEVERMFEVLLQPEVKKRLEEKKHTIMPKTRWSGMKKESGTLEVYEPGSKEKEGFEGVLRRGA
ncbi:MAG: NAD-dependent epimerase/dehydratase family protein [Candidatus Diapherotrites archaeon]|nr:NAD-dependent epimerase/dehydratase family protein [Candidatus Diapherotrites archaeon]